MNRHMHLQAAKLEDLIRAAAGARPAAGRGLLFASRPGFALVNAAFDLFECDELYDLAADVRGQIGLDADGLRLDDDGESVLGPGRQSA